MCVYSLTYLLDFRHRHFPSNVNLCIRPHSQNNHQPMPFSSIYSCLHPLPTSYPLSLSRKTGKHLLSSASSANKWHSTRRTDCIRLPLLLSVDLSRAPLPSFLRLLSQNSESKTGTKIADRPEFLHQIETFLDDNHNSNQKKPNLLHLTTVSF